MKFIKDFIAKVKSGLAAEKYERGYNFAAGQLIQGMSKEDIEVLADNPWDSDRFEEGMRDAIRDFETILLAPEIQFQLALANASTKGQS